MIPRLLSRAAAGLLAVLATTAAVRADDTIIVGFGGGLTGPLSFYDGLVRNGAQMAVDEINAAGGVAGRTKIDFRVSDVRSDASASAEAGRAFVAGGAKVLIAPCDLDAAVAFSKPAQQAKIPIVAPCASTPTLAAAVGDFMFQIYPSDNLQAAALAKFARAQGYRTAYILQSPDTPYAETLPLYFAATFEKMGGTLAGRTSYASGQQEFGAVIAFIRNSNPSPDVIMTAASEPEFPLFLSQLRAAGVTTPVLAGDAVDSPTTLALGDDAEDLIYASPAYPASGSRLETFDRDYAARFGGDPQAEVAPYAATAYEAITVIAAAVAKAGSIDGIATRNAPHGMTDFPGITGARITLAGTNRIALREVALIRVESGKKTLLKTLRPDPTEVPAPQ